MQYKYLLILRYSLINLVGLVFLFVLITQGYISKAIKADITNMVTFTWAQSLLCVSSTVVIDWS